MLSTKVNAGRAPGVRRACAGQTFSHLKHTGSKWMSKGWVYVFWSHRDGGSLRL